MKQRKRKLQVEVRRRCKCRRHVSECDRAHVERQPRHWSLRSWSRQARWHRCAVRWQAVCRHSPWGLLCVVLRPMMPRQPPPWTLPLHQYTILSPATTKKNIESYFFGKETIVFNIRANVGEQRWIWRRFDWPKPQLRRPFDAVTWHQSMLPMDATIVAPIVHIYKKTFNHWIFPSITRTFRSRSILDAYWHAHWLQSLPNQ